jgi:ATP-dependent RNA helicase DOB1
MILNLSRVDGVPPENMLASSFHQYQNSTKIPEIEREIGIYEQRLDELVIDDEEAIAGLYDLRQQLKVYEQDVKNVVTAPSYILPFLQPGRLVKITKTGKEVVEFGWGVIINFQKSFSKQKGGLKAQDDLGYVLDVLLNCDESSVEGDPKPFFVGGQGVGLIVACTLNSIDAISSVRLVTPPELKSAESRNQLRKTLIEVQSRFKSKIPLLDPIKDMKITDSGFIKLQQKIKVVGEKLKENSLESDPNVNEMYEMYESKVEMIQKIKNLKQKIGVAESVLQMDELKCRRRVLRRLEYTDEFDVIQAKGRVACEISAGDELLITEMMFNGLFNELSVEQTNAVLSCFTFGEGV